MNDANEKIGCTVVVASNPVNIREHDNIKNDIKTTRFKIIQNTNKELLYLYFRLGKIIDENSIYGNNFINELSIKLLIKIQPEVVVDINQLYIDFI